MLGARLRTVVFFLGALALVPACRDRGAPGLTRVQMPAAGVPLSLQLDAGQALVGHLRFGSTLQIDGLDDPLNQAFECDLTLQPRPDAPEGLRRLKIVVSNLELNWALPPSASYSSDEFIAVAAEQLATVPLWVDVDAKGAVVAAAPVPANAAPELAQLLVALADAIAASFVVAPDGPAHKGDTWAHDTRRTDGNGTVWAVSMSGRVAGMYTERESDRQLVALDLEVSQQVGADEAQRRGTVRALYATDGYVAEVDRETREFQPSLGVSYRKVRATWTRTRHIQPELVAPTPDTEDVQVISDPCNVDYVGPKTCDDPQRAPEPDSDDADSDDADSDDADADEDEDDESDETDEQEDEDDETDEDEDEATRGGAALASKSRT